MTDADIRWTMSDDTIVRRTGDAPEQATFDPPSFEKVRPGDDLAFDAHIIIDMMDQAHYLKKATVFSNVPKRGTWEIIGDEGKAIGGRGSAPSPFMYFAVGAGFCLMSHEEIVAEQLGIELDRVRLEQKSSFSTTYTLGNIHPREIFGNGETQAFHLLIESDAPEGMMKALWDGAGRPAWRCKPLQAAPVDVALYLNGERVGAIAGQRPLAQRFD